MGYASADVDADGKDDLVWLVQTGPRAGRVCVALSDGAGYGPDQTLVRGRHARAARRQPSCWSATSTPTADRMSASSAAATPDGTAQLAVLKKKPGDAFAAPRAVVERRAGHGHGGGRLGGRRQRRRTGRPHRAPAPRGGRRPAPDGRHEEPPARRARPPAPAAAGVGDDAGPDQGQDRGRRRQPRWPGGRPRCCSAASGPAKVQRLQGQSLGALQARSRCGRRPESDPVPVRRTRGWERRTWTTTG